MLIPHNPRQGEVFLIRALRTIGDTKKRPAVIVSSNVRNELSRTVLIVPFTSNLTGGETSTRILLFVGERGLEENSLALCDTISAIRKSYFKRGPYGEISLELLERIQQGIQVAIGTYLL